MGLGNPGIQTPNLEPRRGFWVREFWLILDMGNPASLILSQEVFFVDSHRLYCTYRGPALLGIMIYASSLSDWGAGGNLEAEV